FFDGDRARNLAGGVAAGHAGGRNVGPSLVLAGVATDLHVALRSAGLVAGGAVLSGLFKNLEGGGDGEGRMPGLVLDRSGLAGERGRNDPNRGESRSLHERIPGQRIHDPVSLGRLNGPVRWDWF